MNHDQSTQHHHSRNSVSDNARNNQAINQNIVQHGTDNLDDGSTAIVPLAQPFSLLGNNVGIVIVHGYGGSIGDYRELGQALHHRGYSVYGIRLAGHGQGQVSLRRSTVADWQASVVEGVALARRTCSQVFLLGSSFGGVLAIDYAASDDQVAGMILVNTALSYSGGGVFQALVLRMMKWFTPDYPKRGLTEEDRRIAARIGSSSAWPIDGILTTSRFAKVRVITKLPSITTPALIMRSDHDPVVGTKNSEQLARLLGAKDKELETIPVSTHRPFRDREANAFMAGRIHQFIQRVLAKQT